jgi:SAM-dependent MidA family methyltransferase
MSNENADFFASIISDVFAGILASLLVMVIWNYEMVKLFQLPELGLSDALCLYALSRLLIK